MGARECVTFFCRGLWEWLCVDVIALSYQRSILSVTGGEKNRIAIKEGKNNKKKLPISPKLPLFLLQTELRRKSNEELCLSE